MIDYHILTRALDFYRAAGFERVETPWTASQAAIRHAFPKNAFLVGSAEQAFLDNPPDFDAMAITPCFRWEDAGRSPVHRPYFMKVELWSRRRTPYELCLLAARFMGADCVVTPHGFDLEIAEIEVGSYGQRHDLQSRAYVYGTGVAEPRFSMAKQQLRNRK